MGIVLKSRDKAVIDEQQRRYYWGLTPQQRLALALRLNQQARAIYAANPANPALPHGRRVLKSAAPIPRLGR